MKEYFKIKLHSIVDVITNSSTELFIIDKKQGLDFVTQLVKEKEREFPCDYGYSTSIFLGNPEYYSGFACNSIDTEDAIKHLEARGYTIVRPEKEIEPEAIIVSCEGGMMSEELREFIAKTFDTEIERF